MYGILNQKPRLSVEETETLFRMLKSQDASLALNIIANLASLIPWKYVQELKKTLKNIHNSSDAKRDIIARQCNRRSRLERKKIYARNLK